MKGEIFIYILVSVAVALGVSYFVVSYNQPVLDTNAVKSEEYIGKVKTQKDKLKALRRRK